MCQRNMRKRRRLELTHSPSLKIPLKWHCMLCISHQSTSFSTFKFCLKHSPLAFHSYHFSESGKSIEELVKLLGVSELVQSKAVWKLVIDLLSHFLKSDHFHMFTLSMHYQVPEWLQSALGLFIQTQAWESLDNNFQHIFHISTKQMIIMFHLKAKLE
jgi:hypothetical protein